jgi:hypothetical protein
VGALGKSLWGGDNGPFSDPEFVEHLRYDLPSSTISLDNGRADNNRYSTFLMNMKRLNAPFNFMIDAKLLTSRRFVRERLEEFSFEEYAEKCAGGSTDAVKETFLGRGS